MRTQRILLIFIVIYCVFISGCTSVLPPTTGTLQLTSSPSGSEVYLDHQFRGYTPLILAEVAVGNHTLEYRYTGYQSWSTIATVSSGTSQVYAALLPVSASQQPQGITTPVATTTATTPVKVTVSVSRNPMIIGEANQFSGTSSGTDGIVLKLYGTGYYAKGIVIDQVKPNSVGLWSYMWTPGSSLLSGTYTLEASDAKKTTTASAPFSVIGGGVVSITSSTFSATQGQQVTFSGQCTSGAKNVNLVLFGHERYQSGVDFGTFPVLADT